jgi:hypothetical protein
MSSRRRKVSRYAFSRGPGGGCTTLLKRRLEPGPYFYSSVSVSEEFSVLLKPEPYCLLCILGPRSKVDARAQAEEPKKIVTSASIIRTAQEAQGGSYTLRWVPPTENSYTPLWVTHGGFMHPPVSPPTECVFRC